MSEKKKSIRFSSLNIDGVKYRTLLTDRFKTRKMYEDNDPNKIKAVIPGTIVEISTKAGRKVKEGEVLLILEAMKMRNAVVAPHDGTIVKLLVKESDIVAKGKIIIEMG